MNGANQSKKMSKIKNLSDIPTYYEKLVYGSFFFLYFARSNGHRIQLHNRSIQRKTKVFALILFHASSLVEVCRSSLPIISEIYRKFLLDLSCDNYPMFL